MFGLGTTSTWLLAVVGALVAYMGTKFAFQRDEKKEDRRRKAMDISEFCAQNGLSFLTPILKDYAVGDYSSLIHRIKELAEKINDPGSVSSVIDGFVEKQLSIRAADPAKAQKLVEVLQKLLPGLDRGGTQE